MEAKGNFNTLGLQERADCECVWFQPPALAHTHIYWNKCHSALKVIAHWVVQVFRMLKNKYDLTLCQSCLHNASETSSIIRKFGSGSILCFFASVTIILIGKDDEYENKKSIWKCQTQCARTFKARVYFTFPQSFQSIKYIEPGMSVDGRARHMRSITYLTWLHACPRTGCAAVREPSWWRKLGNADGSLTRKAKVYFYL